MHQDISKSIEACAANYGDQADAMREYLINGEKAALALPNRGPIEFNADGTLSQKILNAYSEYGFYIFESVLGDAASKVAVSSTKSMIGHLLGAAGAIEAIASILAMSHSLVPPTINHSVVDENIDPNLNLTLNKAQNREVNVAMSNTFGFGGHNACVVFKKYS